MNQKSEEGLFEVLAAELRGAYPEALDCATLFDKAVVRQHAATVNRVSDYLGNLWRKGKVKRVPAPKLEGTRARWMYQWKPASDVPVKPDLSRAVEYNAALDGVLNKAGLDIADDGRTITIMLPELTITIQRTMN